MELAFCFIAAINTNPQAKKRINYTIVPSQAIMFLGFGGHLALPPIGAKQIPSKALSLLYF